MKEYDEQIMEIRHLLMLTWSEIAYATKNLEKASIMLKDACDKYSELMKINV